MMKQTIILSDGTKSLREVLQILIENGLWIDQVVFDQKSTEAFIVLAHKDGGLQVPSPTIGLR